MYLKVIDNDEIITLYLLFDNRFVLSCELSLNKILLTTILTNSLQIDNICELFFIAFEL